jgi:hypothetical protein
MRPEVERVLEHDPVLADVGTADHVRGLADLELWFVAVGHAVETKGRGGVPRWIPPEWVIHMRVDNREMIWCPPFLPCAALPWSLGVVLAR